jgi:hypothetical protein
MFVMLSLILSTSGKLKSLLDRGGNRIRDFWFASHKYLLDFGEYSRRKFDIRTCI